MTRSLLTIAIPAYNRPDHLHNSLLRILSFTHCYDYLEVIVSDDSNEKCSLINKNNISNLNKKFKFNINYFVNNNHGYKFNWLQCFNKANGKYVLILGDDDILINNALEKIINSIQSQREFSLLSFDGCSYTNFNFDIKSQKPAKILSYSSATDFMVRCGPKITHISLVVINKDLLNGFSHHNFTHPSIIQMEYIYTAATKLENYIYIDEYLVAANIEENVWGCNGLSLFSHDLGKILDHFFAKNSNIIYEIEKTFILRLFPIAIYRARRSFEGSLEYKKNIQSLMDRYKNNIWFKYFLKLQITLPLAILPVSTLLLFFVGKIIGRDIKSIYMIMKLLLNKKTN